MRTTSSSGTSPCSVQPKAVDTAPSISTPGWGNCAHLRTSSTICSGVMRTLDSLCLRLAETGKVTLCAPASRARWKPFTFGASATTFTPRSVLAYCTISAVSAIAGMSLGGTNEPTSISFSPAAARAAIQAFLAAVGIRWWAFCSPSRGPTSQIWTCCMEVILGRQATLEAAHGNARRDADGCQREHDPEGRSPAASARRHPRNEDRDDELREV